MELVLFIVFLPSELLTAFFIEDDELSKLRLGIKEVIPRIVSSDPHVQNHLLIFIHFDQICVFVLVTGDGELSYDLHEGELAFLVITQVGPDAIVMHEKAALAMDVLHTYQTGFLLINYAVDITEWELELILRNNACIFVVFKFLNSAVLVYQEANRGLHPDKANDKRIALEDWIVELFGVRFNRFILIAIRFSVNSAKQFESLSILLADFTVN